MKKILVLSFLVFVFSFVLFACTNKNDGEKASIDAPVISLTDGKVEFTKDSNMTYTFEVTGPNGVKTYTLESGAKLEDLGVVSGRYIIKVKAKDASGNESEWSNAIVYESTKLPAPTIRIERNKLYFDLVDGATKYEAIFVLDDKEIVKEIKSGQLLTNLALVSGEYEIYVVAKCEDEELTSVRSNMLTFIVEMQELDVPTGLYIEDDYLFFDVMGATNKYVVKFENASGDVIIEREVESGSSAISELLIPEGSYKVSIKAKGDGLTYSDSPYSEAIDFVKETKFMELKEKDLVNAGYVKWMGRTHYDEDKKVNEIYHSASGFELFFKGSMVSAVITATNYNSSTYRPCIVIVVDDNFDTATTLFLNKATNDVTLAIGINDALEHKVTLYKRSESIDSHIALVSVKTDGVFIKKIEEKPLKIEFIAASSSTGYGNLGSPSSSGKTTENSDCLKGFAFLTAQALNADINIFSASGWGCYASRWTTPNTVNVCDSYEYVDFNSSIPWMHALFTPDVVVVNLGTNDWSYINAATSETEKDARMTAFQNKYVYFLKRLHDLYPDAQIVVLYGLMNESSIYEVTESIVKMAKISIPNLASIKINGDAGGYNSHPSVKSHAEIAKTLTEFIKGLLNN